MKSQNTKIYLNVDYVYATSCQGRYCCHLQTTCHPRQRQPYVDNINNAMFLESDLVLFAY